MNPSPFTDAFGAGASPWAWTPLLSLALACLPAVSCLIGAAWLAASRPDAGGWRAARFASAMAALAALASLAWAWLAPNEVTLLLRADRVGATVALLVAFIGWVIVRYSKTYLDGQTRLRLNHHAAWLLTTLAAVHVVVISNHLLLTTLAWSGTSLALHRLLRFFDTRPAAVLAAHKKFIVARLADACMLAAVVVLTLASGSLRIDELNAAATRGAATDPALHVVMLLVAAAALLKCAQLPFHGWLIQVMEAPTPVSALLHAGIVNLGGFVLIRLAPLLSEVPAAQALLVIVGSLSAVLAALVMTTRISIKVSLAWSTCAQMGFMLMEIGLGLWTMALLHLLAHSLYKAHAFLSAGGAVQKSLLKQMAPALPAARIGNLALAALMAIGLTIAIGFAFGSRPADDPALWLLAGIAALAQLPLFRSSLPGSGRQPGGAATAWPMLASSAALLGLWFGAHAVMTAGMSPTLLSAAAGADAGLHGLLIAWVALLFVALNLMQAAIAIAPHGRLALGLYPWFYGGLFLDERFTRLALRVWPLRAGRATASSASTASKVIA